MFAWPGAEIAVMGAEGATEILFSKKLADNTDKNYKKTVMEKYKEEFMTPYS